MAGKVRYLIQRGGRFHARVVVPKLLRPIIGKVELSAPLGADRREALRRLPAVSATLLDQIATARRRTTDGVPTPAHGRRLDLIEMARIHFSEALEMDVELRDTDPRYASGFQDEYRVQTLKDIIAGRATDKEISLSV